MQENKKMEIKSKSIKFSIATLMVLLCCSCSDATTFHGYETLSSEGWSREQVLNYEVEIDSLNKSSNISLELTYNNDYPYSNLYLFVSANDTIGNEIFSDTLNITLADEFGQWKGDGWGGVYQQKVEYKPAYQFANSGVYNICVKQGMRDNTIVGIERVGVRIISY